MVEALQNPLEGAFWTRPAAEIDSAFDELRAHGPVTFAPHPEELIGGPDGLTLAKGPGAWIVTGHAETLELSKTPAVYSSAAGFSVVDTPEEFNAFFGSLLATDDPRHARLRKIVSAGFTPRMLKRLEDSVQQVATTIVDKIAANGEAEFVTDVAAALPLKIVCDLMGIPDERYEFVFERSNWVLGAADPDYGGPDGDPVGLMLQAGADLTALMAEMAEAKVGSDDTDLTSVLVNTDLGEDRLTDDELASFFVLLVVAGNETTRNAISWGLKFLTDNPSQRELWLSDIDAYTPTAVEEIVRMASPVLHMRRTLLADAELGGQELKTGDKVCQFYYAANRDPRVFDDPYRFDITRAPNPHVGYGGPGPHFCLGAHLARREIGIMFKELLTRLPDIEASEQPSLLHSPFVRGIKAMPARFTPEA